MPDTKQKNPAQKAVEKYSSELKADGFSQWTFFIGRRQPIPVALIHHSHNATAFSFSFFPFQTLTCPENTVMYLFLLSLSLSRTRAYTYPHPCRHPHSRLFTHAPAPWTGLFRVLLSGALVVSRRAQRDIDHLCGRQIPRALLAVPHLQGYALYALPYPPPPPHSHACT